MKQKLIILAVFIVLGGLVSLGKPGPSLAANWYCQTPVGYQCCYLYNQERNCEVCGCVDYDSVPSCDVSSDCNCRTTGSECGSLSSEMCHDASGGWLYEFDGRCTRPDRKSTTGLCAGQWHYKYKKCSAADRCEDPSVGNVAWACGGAGGGTGSNTNGKILPGLCSAGTCSEGCRNGEHYKTCCLLSGAATPGTRLSDETGACSGGGCSRGVPVRWANFGSPGPACSNTLCLQSWDGWSWIVDTCDEGSPPPPTTAPGQPTPTPVVTSTPPSVGSFCGKCNEYWSCDWGGSGGCSVSPCERIYHGYGPDPCPVSGPIHGGSCCSWCYSKGWDLGCGSAPPARPALNSPASGISINTPSIEFRWNKFLGGEEGDCGGCDTSGQNHCWGFRCAMGSYGMPVNWRKYELFVSRVPNLTSSQSSAKKPSHWGSPRAVVDTSTSPKAELWVKGESGYTSPNWNSRIIDFSTSAPGTYWWFVRACNPDGCRDSSLRSFSYCTPIPPGQANCQIPSGGEVLNDTVANLTWTGPVDWGQGCPDNKSYEIYVGTSLPPTDWSGISAAASPLVYTDLNYGNFYYWSVKTVNNNMFTHGPVCNFSVREPDPWWQTKDGDVHADSGLFSTVIPGCAPTELYLSLDGDGGSPGLVSWGGGKEPNVGRGEISSTGWQANTSLSTPISFTYLKNRLQIDESVVLPSEGGVAEIPASGTYYSAEENLQLTGRTLAVGEKVVIFAAGNVTVTSNLIVPPGSFFALISNKTITFAGSVTQADGFFLADESLVVASGKIAFTGNGSFIGLQAITFNRDLSNGTTGGCTPAEVFVFRPDFFLSAPDDFKYSSFLFQELAP
ncbi:MAG: hypothetical protein ACOX50_01650 [Patescibacteria group bacterium]|jgi:hypothetical protein